MVNLTEEEAQRLVKSLFAATQMYGADADERARRRAEIGKELMNTARSLEYAEAVIQRCKESFDEFPTVRQFQDIASAVSIGDRQQSADIGRSGCDKCNGLGWIYGAVMGKGAFRHIKYTCVARCSCTGGAA